MARSWVPSPMGPRASSAVTLKTRRRPSTSVSSARQVTSRPTGVGLRCLAFIRVPTVPSPSARWGATDVQAACSRWAIITGVASTSRVPLPTVLAVSSSVTTNLTSAEIPGCNIGNVSSFGVISVSGNSLGKCVSFQSQKRLSFGPIVSENRGKGKENLEKRACSASFPEDCVKKAKGRRIILFKLPHYVYLDFWRQVG